MIEKLLVVGSASVNMSGLVNRATAFFQAYNGEPSGQGQASFRLS